MRRGLVCVFRLWLLYEPRHNHGLFEASFVGILWFIFLWYSFILFHSLKLLRITHCTVSSGAGTWDLVGVEVEMGEPFKLLAENVALQLGPPCCFRKTCRAKMFSRREVVAETYWSGVETNTVAVTVELALKSCGLGLYHRIVGGSGMATIDQHFALPPFCESLRQHGHTQIISQNTPRNFCLFLHTGRIYLIFS